MIGKTQNAILQQVEQAITQKVDPSMAQAFERIVTAGLKVMYDPQTHPMMVKQLSKPGDPATIAGEGAAALLGLLYKESKGSMPIKPAVLAAQIWLCEGLDFMAQAGQIEITNDLVAEATKSLMSHILQIFGVNPNKINQAAQAGQQATASSDGIVGGAMA
jgi:hypothetical protein